MEPVSIIAGAVIALASVVGFIAGIIPASALAIGTTCFVLARYAK